MASLSRLRRKAAGPAGVPAGHRAWRRRQEACNGIAEKRGRREVRQGSSQSAGPCLCPGLVGRVGRLRLGTAELGTGEVPSYPWLCLPRLLGDGEPQLLGPSGFSHSSPGIPVLLLLLGFPVFVGVRTLKIRVRVQGPQAGVGSCELGAVKGAALLQATSPGAHREPG